MVRENRSRRTAAALVLFSFLSAGTAPAQDDARAELAQDDLDAAMAQQVLLLHAEDLRTGAAATADGPVVVNTDLSVASRSAEAKSLREAYERGAAALREAGWTIPAELPPLLVVRVVRPKGLPQRFATDDRSVVLVRETEAPPRAEIPAAPTRSDGPPLLRDVTEASDRARLALADVAAAAAAARGRGSLAGFVSDRLLGVAGVPASLPPWCSAALREWVAARAFPPKDGETPRHACGHLLTGRSDLLEKMLDPARVPNDAEAAVLGQWLERLRGGRADFPARLAALAASGGKGAKSVGEAFGADAVAAFVETAKALPKTGATCELEGAPCTVCKGRGKSEVACESCAGLGQTCCPACNGSELCPVPLCWGGTLGLTGTARFCRLCSVGKVKCLACAGKLRLPCKGCRGGKLNVDCLACDGGKVPCAEAGMPQTTERPCPWCREKVSPVACRACSGVTFLGCESCRGIGKTVCRGCDGTGMGKLAGGYYRGICSRCNGTPDRCSACTDGKFRCEPCSGKGTGPWGADCPSCAGTHVVTAEAGRARLAATRRGASAEEGQATKETLDRAIAFVLTCNRTASGAFALRDFRDEKDGPAGALSDPSLFSNAICLWALVSAGIERGDPRTAAAWKKLESDAKSLVASKVSEAGTQSASLALRAFVSAGEDPKGPLVKGLVQKLVKAQRPNGLWADDLDSQEDGESFAGLFALESLWLAQRRGAEVPGAVFIKAERGAKIGTRGRDVRSLRRADYVNATDVASSVALAVIAKAGSLKDRSGTFDYRTLPEVQKGLAWLDRYFEVENQPIFNKGARVPRRTDAGWAAYMFAVQRVAQLLGIETFGGQRWYARGADILRARQLADGSFEEQSADRLNGPVRMTVTALLFLIRATPSVSDR